MILKWSDIVLNPESGRGYGWIYIYIYNLAYAGIRQDSRFAYPSCKSNLCVCDCVCPCLYVVALTLNTNFAYPFTRNASSAHPLGLNTSFSLHATRTISSAKYTFGSRYDTETSPSTQTLLTRLHVMQALFARLTATQVLACMPQTTISSTMYTFDSRCETETVLCMSLFSCVSMWL